MVYVKFLNSNVAIPCIVEPKGNIVAMKFPDTVIVNTSGFNLYLDEKCEYDIGAKFYQGFKTIYRNDEETAKFNGYQLSNDGSVYVKPEKPKPLPVPEPVPPTEEEIAEMERQSQISEKQNQIVLLKAELQSTDYVFIKCYEASLVGKKVTEYNLEKLHEERQIIREQINTLEEEILTLESEVV